MEPLKNIFFFEIVLFKFEIKVKSYGNQNHFLIMLLNVCYTILMALNNCQLMDYNLVLSVIFDFQNTPITKVNHNHNQDDCFGGVLENSKNVE